MINLLPEEDKILIKNENLRRFIAVSGVLFFSLLCAAVILFTPSYLLVESQEKNFEKQLLLIKESFERENIDQIESSARDLNSQLASYAKQEELFVGASSLFLEIIGKKPPLIRLDNFSYTISDKEGKPDKISLRGFSSDRESLVSFTKKLEQSGLFSKVGSPLSNFLKEKNINFSLNLELFRNK
jgi:hypothetical protein